MVGRDRTCDAPRFRRALYRLSFDHVDGQGWTRTSSLLFVRQALYPLSYSPTSIEGGSRTLTGVAHGALDAARLPFRHLDVKLRDKGSNLDLRVQSAVSYRLDDPGPCLSVQLLFVGSSTQRHSVKRCSARAEPPMSMPLAYPSTLDRRPRIVHVRGTTSSWRGFGAGVSCAAAKCAGKSTR